MLLEGAADALLFLMLLLAPPQVRRGAFIAEDARIAGRMVEKTRSGRAETRKGKRASSSAASPSPSFVFSGKKV